MSRKSGNENLTRDEVAHILEGFLDGKCGPWDWDDFTSLGPIDDAYLEAIRVRCVGLGEEFPPGASGGYCSEQGLETLRSYLRQLKNEEQ